MNSRAEAPVCPAGSPRALSKSLVAARADRGAARRASLAAAELRYLTRLLGHPPTRSDAALLPGVEVSDLDGYSWASD
jgi:hypothetical protein